MNRLKITLKQHTPLIHFQHDQDGATLRASEVKPKLDRFILNKLGTGKMDLGDETKQYEKRIQELKQNNSGKMNHEIGFIYAKEQQWLIGKGDHPALDFKMSIACSEKRTEYLIASNFSGKIENETNVEILKNTPYFAQEEYNSQTDIIDNKNAVIYRTSKEEDYIFREDKWDIINKKGLEWKNISLSIFCLNNNLSKLLNKYLDDFFLCTNFGTRSNKGFGSFSVINESSKKERKENIDDILKENFSVVYKNKNVFSDLKIIFSTIKSDYQLIKSGINLKTKYKDEYKKSLLFCYAVDKMNKKPRWEKRAIKKVLHSFPFISLFEGRRPNGEPIHSLPNLQKWDDNPKLNYMFIRALLGLAEQYEFLVYDRNNINSDRNKKIIVRIKSKTIERFQSPIIFKVINKTLYLLANDINNDILDEEFTFNYSIKTGKETKDILLYDQSIKKIDKDIVDTVETTNIPTVGKALVTKLSTPQRFSLKEFIDYAMNFKENKVNVLKNYVKIL